MAVDVTFPIRVKVAEDGPELAVPDSGLDIGDEPAPDSPNSVAAFVVESLQHGRLLVTA